MSTANYKFYDLTILGAGDTDIEFGFIGRIRIMNLSVAATCRLNSPDNSPIPCPVVAASWLTPLELNAPAGSIRITTTVATVMKFIVEE